MKIFKKLSSFTLIPVIMLIFLTGCINGGGGGGGQQINPDMTQLYVGMYNGGFGTEWLEKAIERFEQEYAETSFEEGKMGVQVFPDYDKDKYNGTIFLDTVAASPMEVLFPSGLVLHEMQSKALDITDIVRETLAEFGEPEYTIEDKLKPVFKNGAEENAYYSLPMFEGYMGIVYDIDLFNEYKLYFSSEGTLGKKSTDSGLSSGPDGKANTYDDGLPQTYDQFFELCAYMKRRNITPISLTGQYKDGYVDYLYQSLVSDYEGMDTMTLLYNVGKRTAEGTNKINIIDKFVNGQPVIKEIEVTAATLKESVRQPGRYYALKFFEDLVAGSYFTPLSFEATQSHVMAQADFLYSNREGSPIAMLIDGVWWQKESEEIFNSMVFEFGEEYSAAERSFGFMPMPKQNADSLGTATSYCGTGSNVLINANIREDKIPLAKLFVKYLFTDVSLVDATVVTNATLTYDYSLGDRYDELSPYGRAIWNYRDSADIVYRTSSTAADAYAFTNTRMSGNHSYMNLNGSNQVLSSFLNAFRYDGVSAQQYFNGLYAYITR